MINQTLTYHGRLPGVLVQTALPPQGEAPIRLDVAAFVGFAERGPLNTPVVLEDVSQYKQVFGGDILVARDNGLPVFANLPYAVKAFFDNGGRRCYVVRVAGEGARANRFRIPGLTRWDSETGLLPVEVEASWVGSWSDTLTIGTQLLHWPLRVTDYRQANARAEVDLEVPELATVQPGDLLQLRFNDATRSLVFLSVTKVDQRGRAQASTRGIPVSVSAESARLRVFATQPIGGSLPVPNRIEILTSSGWQNVPMASTPKLELAENNAGVILYTDLTADAHPGDVLRLHQDGKAVSGLFCVETAGLRPNRPDPNPPPEQMFTTSEILWDVPQSLPRLWKDIRADRLTFDLVIHERLDGEANLIETLADLRFAPLSSPMGLGQPVYWADTLTHASQDPLYGVRVEQVGECGNGLEAPPVRNTAASPIDTQRHSLRLRAPTSALSSDPPLYLPLSMSNFLPADRFAEPLPEDPSNALPGKDGLDRFDPPKLFLDDKVGQLGARDLAVEAEALLYLAHPVQRLSKLHSLYAIEEVALIALPDAVQRGWEFHDPLKTAEQPTKSISLPPQDSALFYPCPLPSQIVHSFFQNLQAGDEPAARALLTDDLNHSIRSSLARFVLGVSCSVNIIQSYQFQVSLPLYLGEAAYVLGTITPAESEEGGSQPVNEWFTLMPAGPGWRIACIDRAPTEKRDDQGAPLLAKRSELIPVDAYQLDGLLQVQAALINLCAARADVLAVLSLPAHFDTREALDWQQQLTAVNGMLDGTVLSYAAVYHPWLSVKEVTTPQLAPTRAVPPDGAVTGLISARELARGPWIAPANQPFAGVVDLTPSLSTEDWVALFNRQMNLIRHQPGQFSTWSAHTLSLDPLFLQVSVRRLLIFLRKLCLRRGTQYVFESNNERFRRRVQSSFENTLRLLLQRGALNSFQVITDGGLNTLNDSDNGRFIVALKIAPTSPVEFITVVMLRRGEDYLQILEI